MIDRLDDSLTGVRELLQRNDTTERRGDGSGIVPDGSRSDDRETAGDASTGEDARERTAADDSGWSVAESPTSRTLHDVVHGQDGPYACGEGGILVHRAGEEWRVILERGPGVSDNTLRSIAATDDGCRLWFAGDSGALGFYDVADGFLSDYSAPMEKTSTWEAISVTGQTGEERVRIANGSGEVLECIVEDGCPVWGEVVEPGGGSTIPGLTAGPEGIYAIDTSGGAYYEALDGESADGESGTDDAPDTDPRDGEPADTEPTDTEPTDEWERIGVRNAQVDFQDVWAGDDLVYIAGADGIAYRYDPLCENWTPLHVGEGALNGIQARGTDAVAVATGGRIYERDQSVRWTRAQADTEQTLLGLDLARSGADADGLATVPIDVAVGASGTIVERERPDRSTASDRSS